MSLKDEVCTVEYAKSLKALGVPQVSSLQWVEAAWKYEINTNLEKKIIETKVELVMGNHSSITDIIDVWAAYTIGELMELMPLINGTPLQLIKGATIIEGMIYAARYDNVCENFTDTNPANCLARMFIHIINNKWYRHARD